MSVLVTGGAGYIGSHMVLALLDRGEEVLVIDNLSTGVADLVDPRARFIQADIGDREIVNRLLRQHEVSDVIHFAGSVIVPESVINPLLYYRNNTCASLNLISACLETSVSRFVFSSTAAVYGVSDRTQVKETDPKDPINPYGQSKLMVEQILSDTAKAYDFVYHALRYFNVAGADPERRTGQSTPRATHLIKRACEAATGQITHLDIFGTDFSTPDGTGVRDYIHVSDLVDAHLLALDAMRNGAQSDVYNCGYGRGLSVREIITAVETASGEKLAVQEKPRRLGDPAMLIADSSKLQSALNWVPKYADTATIVGTALAWERARLTERTRRDESQIGT
jgi:UDP-glucose 4-epimerase